MRILEVGICIYMCVLVFTYKQCLMETIASDIIRDHTIPNKREKKGVSKTQKLNQLKKRKKKGKYTFYVWQYFGFLKATYLHPYVYDTSISYSLSYIRIKCIIYIYIYIDIHLLCPLARYLSTFMFPERI